MVVWCQATKTNEHQDVKKEKKHGRKKEKSVPIKNAFFIILIV